MKRYIKEHKVVVASVIFMLIIIVIAFIVKATFFTNSENAVYGNRLDGIEEVKVDSEQKNDITKSLEEDSAVKKAKYKLQGKIINITITLNDDVGVDTAKSLSKKILEKLSDKQKEYFDVQVFVKKDNGASDFPIIGYKHHAKGDFSWTKDREAQ